MGLIDSTSGEFILAPCDTPLDANSKIRVDQHIALTSKNPRNARQYPIIYDAASSVTSDEVYSEVRVRYARGGVPDNSWMMFGIHYDAMHPNKLIFSPLPYDLTRAAEKGFFLEGLIGTEFEWQFLSLHTAVTDAIHRIQLDKVIKYDDAACRVSQKEIKEEAPFISIIIAKACLESYQEMAIFTKPVVTMDGQLYERQEIEAWLKHHSTSPLTNEILNNTTLVPFKLLENILQRPRYEIVAKDLICPLTNRFMKEPVLASNGVLYEREAIQREFNLNPPSNKINDIVGRYLISIPWVNCRREELIKKNPHIINPIRPPAEALKSTHSAILGSFKEEEKKLPAQEPKQEMNKSKQIYSELMRGVSFSNLLIQEKIRLIGAIIRQKEDAYQQNCLTGLAKKHIHILVDMLDVFKANNFKYTKEELVRFQKNITEVRNQQLESIKNKLFEMSQISFSTLQTDAEKIKYVYRLCTFDEAQLNQLLASQACFFNGNIRALYDFSPVVFERYNLPPHVRMAVSSRLQMHLKMEGQVGLSRHQREKEQKEEDACDRGQSRVFQRT